MLDLAQMFDEIEKEDDTAIDQTETIEPTTSESAGQYVTGYSISQGRKVDVELRDGATMRFGQLLDLSSSGAKIATSLEFKIGDKITLSFEIPDAEIDIQRDATIAWTGCRNQDKWTVGCSFTEELDESTVEQLARSGCLERRAEQRIEISVCARVRLQDQRDRTLDVRLRDFSSGGFGMISPMPIEQGTRLVLEVPRDTESVVSIPAEVRWQNHGSDGRIVGCRFMEPTDLTVFRNATQSCQNQLRLSRWGWIGLFSSMAWFAMRAIA